MIVGVHIVFAVVCLLDVLELVIRALSWDTVLFSSLLFFRLPTTVPPSTVWDGYLTFFLRSSATASDMDTVWQTHGDTTAAHFTFLSMMTATRPQFICRADRR